VGRHKIPGDEPTGEKRRREKRRRRKTLNYISRKEFAKKKYRPLGSNRSTARIRPMRRRIDIGRER
jgi:hypothetical protein